METNKINQDITELKLGHKELSIKQDQHDKIITDLTNSLKDLSKRLGKFEKYALVGLGLYASEYIGADTVLKKLVAVLLGG